MVGAIYIRVSYLIYKYRVRTLWKGQVAKRNRAPKPDRGFSFVKFDSSSARFGVDYLYVYDTFIPTLYVYEMKWKKTQSWKFTRNKSRQVGNVKLSSAGDVAMYSHAHTRTSEKRQKEKIKASYSYTPTTKKDHSLVVALRKNVLKSG